MDPEESSWPGKSTVGMDHQRMAGEIYFWVVKTQGLHARRARKREGKVLAKLLCSPCGVWEFGGQAGVVLDAGAVLGEK